MMRISLVDVWYDLRSVHVVLFLEQNLKINEHSSHMDLRFYERLLDRLSVGFFYSVNKRRDASSSTIDYACYP